MRLAIVAVLFLCVDAASAQIVAGTVLDEAGAAIPGATVRLLAGADTVASTAADREGQFLVQARAPGTYRLSVSAVGFAPTASEPFAMARAQSLLADVVLERSTTVLPDVGVVDARIDPVLARTGFHERRGEGQGWFIDRAEIERRQPRQLTDLFVNVPGFVPLVEEGDVRVATINTVSGSRSGTNCRPTIVVDGVVLRSHGITYGSGGSLGAASGSSFNLDAAIRVGDVEAIEVYARSGVPPRYAGTTSPCGAILIWTRYYAERADPSDAGR